ncbi:hypothetical protein K8I85_00420, partial [bacterium]|nr:hypothetical protein [bacterium]
MSCTNFTSSRRVASRGEVAASSGLALEDARYVVPDLVVAEVDGEYVVSLADGAVPRLRVSRKYREILQHDAAVNGKAREDARREA